MRRRVRVFARVCHRESKRKCIRLPVYAHARVVDKYTCAHPCMCGRVCVRLSPGAQQCPAIDVQVK